MVRALPYIVPVALAVFTLIEVSRAQAWEMGGLPRWAWIGIVLLLPVVGPVVWLVLSRMRRAEARATGTGGYPQPGAGSGGGSGTPGPRPRRQGPLAPDDDPDFLWRLEREARRRRAQEGGGEQGPTDEPQPESAPEDDPRP